MRNEPPRTAPWLAESRYGWTMPFILGAVVLLASLVGIVTRFDNAMAATWPANAILLGIFLRLPATATAPACIAAFAAYVGADLLTGAELLKALLLGVANICSVLAIFMVYQRLPPAMVRIRHPMSVVYLSVACAAGAFSAAVIGGTINPLLFDASVVRGFILWFVTEYANYIAILPLMLCAPSPRQLLQQPFHCLPLYELKEHPLPCLAMLFSLLATVVIGGPGAIGFSVPALLWCALRYSIFTITLLTLLTSLWALTFIAQSGHYQESQLVSLRLGIALVALAPIMLSCVMQSHIRLMQSLHYLAAHDGLTGTQNRNAFLTQASAALCQTQDTAAVLMVDIDHFKSVNDSFGHAAGDTVLVAVINRIRHCLRAHDIIGRMGGEEFAVLLISLQREEICAIAERMRATIADHAIGLNNGQALKVTVSIGLVISAPPHPYSIEQLLAQADKALYQAKETGRDRVVAA